MTVLQYLLVIIIIIITFKGAIRDFLQSPHSAANCLQHVCSSGPGTIVCNHVKHIERLSRTSVMLHATWYEGTAQLLSLIELKSHLFELYFIGWTIKLMKDGRKPEYSEKTSGDEVQKSFSKAIEHLPVSLLVIISGKGLWVAGPVLQVDCQ